MPIRRHLVDKAAFNPDEIAAMSKAFEEACTALRVFAGDVKGREIVAARIVNLIRGGLTDSGAIRDRIVSEVRQLKGGSGHSVSDDPS